MLEAREAATRALALDSTSGDAMAVEALVVAGLELDWPLAEATAHRGIRAAPRAVRPWQSLAFLLGSMGRFDEAIAVAESALVRDSLSVANHWAMAMLLIDGHRWDQFPVWEERWRASDPVLAAYARGYSALHDQRPHDALRAFRTLPYQDIVVEVEALIACDSTASARALVARERSRADTQLRDTGFYVVADGLAAGYAMLGEIDEAFVWLERAYGWANTNLLWRLKVFPGFERLRADPRYRDLLQRMRLEH
jgi:tetratricopeptide (TPR) repeat protein